MELRAFIAETRRGKDSTHVFNSGSTLLKKSSSFDEARIRLNSGVSSDIMTLGKCLGSCLNYAVVLLAGIQGLIPAVLNKRSWLICPDATIIAEDLSNQWQLERRIVPVLTGS